MKGIHGLVVLLTIVSTNALAEWVRVGTSGQVVAYIDPSATRREGQIVKLWELSDFPTPQAIMTQRYLSMKSQSEYDCIRAVTRTVYVSIFAGNMASGEVVGVNPNPSQWVPVSPGSLGKAMWSLACQ